MLRCKLEKFEGTFFSKSKRLVFFQDTSGKYKPIEGLYEFQQGQAAEAVRIEHRPFNNFHGLNISDNQALEGKRLQIREDIERAIEYKKPLKGTEKPGRKAGLQVLDERVTQQLRRVMAREINIERQKQGYLERKFKTGKGFMRNVAEATKVLWVGEKLTGGVSSALKAFGFKDAAEAVKIRNEDEVGARVEEKYGPEVNIDERRKKLAKDVWTPLNASQRAAVMTELLNRGVAVPAPAGSLDGQVLQLAAADAEQLLEMRVALSTPPNAVFPSFDPKNNPLFPISEAEPPAHSIDRLIQLRNIEMRERTKLLSTTIYDPQRLQHFLDEVKTSHADVHKKLEGILVENALYPLENHEEAQALVAYLEYRWRRRGPEDLKAELDNIEKKLPDVKEEAHEEKKDEKDAHAKEGHHHEESAAQKLEKAKASLKKMQETAKILKKAYAEAGSLGQSLYDTQLRFNLLGAPSAPGAKGDPARGELMKAINDLEREKRTLLVKIQDQEGTFKDGSSEMLSILNGLEKDHPLKVGTALPTGDVRVELLKFYTGLAPITEFSQDKQIFGETNASNPRGDVPGSRFSNFIKNDFNDETAEKLKKEMSEHNKKTAAHKKKRQSPRRLLMLFKQGDVFRQGITNPEQSLRFGEISANLAIADADHERMLKVFRQTNQELSEKLGATTLGSRRFNRLGKWLAAKTNIGGVYEAEDVINYVAGFDKDFAMFKDLKRDTTITEFRDLIERGGGITPLKLSEFAQKLIEMYQSFQVLNSEGKVELWENHAVDMEELIGLILVVSTELRSQERHNKNRGKEGDVIHNCLEGWEEEEKTGLKEEKELLGKIADKFADWKKLFSKKVLKHQYLGKIEEARKEMSAKNMNYKERRAFLSSQGLLTPWKILKTGLAAKEAYDVGAAVGGWTWNKIVKPSGQFTYDTGADAVKGAWNRVLRPVGENLVYKPAKFVVWDVPSWTAEKVANMVTFPFRMAEKIFNWGKGTPKAGGGDAHGGADAHGGGHAAPAGGHAAPAH